MSSLEKIHVPFTSFANFHCHQMSRKLRALENRAELCQFRLIFLSFQDHNVLHMRLGFCNALLRQGFVLISGRANNRFKVRLCTIFDYSRYVCAAALFL